MLGAHYFGSWLGNLSLSTHVFRTWRFCFFRPIHLYRWWNICFFADLSDVMNANHLLTINISSSFVYKCIKDLLQLFTAFKSQNLLWFRILYTVDEMCPPGYAILINFLMLAPNSWKLSFDLCTLIFKRFWHTHFKWEFPYLIFKAEITSSIYNSKSTYYCFLFEVSWNNIVNLGQNFTNRKVIKCYEKRILAKKCVHAKVKLLIYYTKKTYLLP